MPGIAPAQPAGGRYRIGWLATTDSFREPYGLAFLERLRELGFVEGRNLVIERRHADGRIDSLPTLAGELAGLKSDALFGAGTEAALAALQQASRSIPIVYVAVDFDPVTSGQVASLARPGGNTTGVTTQQSVLPGKRLELLKELLPRVRRVAVFTNEQTTGQLEVAQEAARRMGLVLHVVDFKRPPFDYESGFADAVKAKSDALMILGSGLWVPARRKLPELALKAKLPSMFHQLQWAEAGGLVSYGFSFPEMWRRGADLVEKVLRGAKPGDIPMEQPTRYELGINMRTAKALGIRVPQSMRLRADRLIE